MKPNVYTIAALWLLSFGVVYAFATLEESYSELLDIEQLKDGKVLLSFVLKSNAKVSHSNSSKGNIEYLTVTRECAQAGWKEV